MTEYFIPMILENPSALLDIIFYFIPISHSLTSFHVSIILLFRIVSTIVLILVVGNDYMRQLGIERMMDTWNDVRL